MNRTVDILVLIARFVFGAILGGVLSFGPVILFSVDIEIGGISTLTIAGIFTLLVAICATIWGDKFLTWFLKIFKYIPPI